MFLSKHVPSQNLNRMSDVGNLLNAREKYLDGSNKNLIFLLKSRFNWMNKFIDPNMSGVELGSGIAASKDFIVAKNLITTDFTESKWIDMSNVDALSTPFDKNSQDFIVASNVIHHCAKPMNLFEEAYRILRPGGKFLIQEVYTSIIMRFILRFTNHEGFDESINVFDKDLICNDPNDAWSANCSIPKLLFEKKTFVKYFPNWEITYFNRTEFFSFINSGGVTAKIFYIPLNSCLLNFFSKLDKLIVGLAPKIFALQVQIVLEKRK